MDFCCAAPTTDAVHRCTGGDRAWIVDAPAALRGVLDWDLNGWPRRPAPGAQPVSYLEIADSARPATRVRPATAPHPTACYPGCAHRSPPRSPEAAHAPPLSRPARCLRHAVVGARGARLGLWRHAHHHLATAGEPPRAGAPGRCVHGVGQCTVR